ncbi:hypothetical protein XENTR_v10012531 [Xenopus tropicalis]|nr:hypothetical protein XENTR_v10012531 [Xenopus tropicalis]
MVFQQEKFHYIFQGFNKGVPFCLPSFFSFNSTLFFVLPAMSKSCFPPLTLVSDTNVILCVCVRCRGW